VWAVGVPGWEPARPMTVDDLLQKAVELGVSVVQIADNLPLDWLDAGELDALASRAGALGIEIEAGTRGIRPDHLRTYVRIAERVGARFLRTLIDAAGHRPDEDEAVACLRAVAADLKATGVTLGIENHDRFRAVTLRRIVERAGSENIGVCLDTANSLGCGEGIEQVAACLAPLVVNLHVKDFAARRLPHNKGFIVEGCPAGEGLVDVPALIDVLRRAGRDFNAIVEVWPPPEPDLAASITKEDEWARRSVAYLRSLKLEA
jgi:sugar phosphate isomerase/epimerase